jgi:hypothetical protein
MTADYLLTARDLPGWPGKFKSISFDTLLRASFNLVENSSFEGEVLIRELKILKEIAKQHNLQDLFNQLMINTKRKIFLVGDVYDFVITNSIRFEGSELGIHNIFDASLATNFVYQFYNKISINTVFDLFKNTIKILVRSKKYKREHLPKI